MTKLISTCNAWDLKFGWPSLSLLTAAHALVINGVSDYTTKLHGLRAPHLNIKDQVERERAVVTSLILLFQNKAWPVPGHCLAPSYGCRKARSVMFDHTVIGSSTSNLTTDYSWLWPSRIYCQNVIQIGSLFSK